MEFKPKGVCIRNISFELKDGKIYNTEFSAGCNGNSQGIAKLVEGMPARDVIAKLKGIQCERKGTSCPAKRPAMAENTLPAKLLGERGLPAVALCSAALCGTTPSS